MTANDDPLGVRSGCVSGSDAEGGARGDADALLVHDRIGEDKFVADGYGIDRRDVTYNDFVIVGPNSDPAHIRGLKDARVAFSQIAAAEALFASRGDDSGTNRTELRLWKLAGFTSAIANALPPRRQPGRKAPKRDGRHGGSQ